MLSYALAIFTGAFLLFAVQPLIGKYILPWFGGSTEVWTACMLVFQALLLAGYAYAHLVVRYLRPRMQSVVHLLLLAAGAATLPIAPAPRWQPQGGENPTLLILLLLIVSVGLPYAVLASTSPLMQHWFARRGARQSPYWLYALSNAGSLLALASYPFLIEPAMTRQQQATVWSWGWGLFAVLSAVCAIQSVRRSGAERQAEIQAAPPAAAGGAPSPTLGRRLLWLAMPAGAAVVLLAATNVICLDLAVIPFLWVLPLCLYLLSFVICFAGERWYVRPAFVVLFMAALAAVIWLRARPESLPILGHIVIYLAVLFACCMVCHGELFRLRPAPQRLTSYYLMISAGGALGGFFVAVVAPMVFTSYVELYVGMAAGCLFALLGQGGSAPARRQWLYVAATAAVAAGVVFLGLGAGGDARRRIVAQTRNFYGVLTLWEQDADDPLQHCHILQHGTTFHGLQFAQPPRRANPTAYYDIRSGAGLAMRCLAQATGRRVGVVGLGVGTLAAYGKSGDVFRFYEINPAVVEMAQRRFGYLGDTPATTQVVLGDARLSLQREAPQQFDLLVLDAFASDAIPVHLLTAQAFEAYLKHLKPEGVLAVHISTHHLDLQAVILALAEHFGLRSATIESDDNEPEGVFPSTWVLLSRGGELLDAPEIRKAAQPPAANRRPAPLWTDDRVSLLDVLK